MTPVYTIPVLIRRLFGRSYRLVRAARPAGAFGAGGDSFGPGSSPRVGELVQTIDHSHGTRHSVDEIRAMFAPDPHYPNHNGMTVNDLWAPAGVEFAVRGARDDAIASDLADFAVSGDRVFRAILFGLDEPDVINLYFVRDLHSARGFAKLYRPHVPRATTHIVIADNFDLDSWRGGGDAGVAFRRWHNIVTLAHEFGHVLGLPHMPGLTNVMRGEGTTGNSTELDPTQAVVARYRAKYLSGDERPAMIGVPAGLPGTP